MKYQSHIVIAAAVITLTQPWSQGLLPALAIYGLGLLGGLLPDIDHPKSFIGSKVPVLPTILYKFGGHRGVTHSLLGLGIVAIIGFLLASLLGMREIPAVTWALGLGYASHLGADLITNRGIPACWPVAKRFVIPVTTTGSALEAIIVLSVFGIALSATLGVLIPWPALIAAIKASAGTLSS